MLMMVTAQLLAVPVRASTLDCWPVSKQLAAQVLRTPMNDGGILVVVEDSLCDANGVAPVIDPAPVVPADLRRALTPVDLGVARAAGVELVPLGPSDFHPVIQSVVASVDQALGRPGFARVDTSGASTRVTAGDAAFLDQLVDVKPEACPWMDGEGWTIHTAQYCILDQIAGRVFTPRQISPGWAGRIQNGFLGEDIPLLDAVIQLYTVNGVQPLAFFFLSRTGQGADGPVRRISLEVHYPTMPPDDGEGGTFEDDYPGRPEKVPRPVPGDED